MSFVSIEIGYPILYHGTYQFIDQITGKPAPKGRALNQRSALSPTLEGDYLDKRERLKHPQFDSVCSYTVYRETLDNQESSY